MVNHWLQLVTYKRRLQAKVTSEGHKCENDKSSIDRLSAERMKNLQFAVQKCERKPSNLTHRLVRSSNLDEVDGNVDICQVLESTESTSKTK